LLAFAAFLASRAPPRTVAVRAEPEVLPEALMIERPRQESIVGALKRLSKSYPMLNKAEMLSATSELVATSLMQGSDPVGVIDELEKIFSAHYEQFKSGNRS